jgi:hypothetical protein
VFAIIVFFIFFSFSGGLESFLISFFDLLMVDVSATSYFIDFQFNYITFRLWLGWSFAGRVDTDSTELTDLFIFPEHRFFYL